ncbi:Haloacid dehalogenase-like hydrolase [uncultured archaeon]|nr:Haloacid dehalogenase-like hydrolase [uncultured archaeon]
MLIYFSNDDHYYPYLSKISGVSVRKIKRIIEGRPWSWLDKDEISQMDFDRMVSHKLGIEEKDIKWYEAYVKEGRLNRPLMREARKLSKSYKVAYLTNVDMSRYTYTIKVMKPYAKVFDREFASCYIHLRKPGKEIYLYAAHKLGVKPEEAVFIDNQKNNVDGAKRAGLKAILFKNNEDLRKKLRKLEVKW